MSAMAAGASTSSSLLVPFRQPARISQASRLTASQRLFSSFLYLRRNQAGGNPIGSASPSQFLSRPTWSVRALLPESKTAPELSVTSEQLRHLLRLSALPSPSSPAREAEKLKVLQSQLHFVQDVQSVDTTGVKPLRSIRDETELGLKEQSIGVKELETALLQEEVFGHRKRPRRRRKEEGLSSVESWDVLGSASRKAGRYFVVNSGNK